MNMDMKMAIPCFLFFTALPKVKQRATGMSNREIISRILVKGLAFSSGCAELTPM